MRSRTYEPPWTFSQPGNFCVYYNFKYSYYASLINKVVQLLQIISTFLSKFISQNVFCLSPDIIQFHACVKILDRKPLWMSRQAKSRAGAELMNQSEKAWKVLKVRPCLPDRAVFVKDFCIFDNLTGCPNVKRRRDSYQPLLPGRFCSGQRPYSSFTRKFSPLFHEVIGGCSPLCKFPTLVYER